MVSHSFGDPLHRKPHRGKEKRYQTPICLFACHAQKEQPGNHQRYKSGSTGRNTVVVCISVAFDFLRIHRHKARQRRENKACCVSHRAGNRKAALRVLRQRDNRLRLTHGILRHRGFRLPYLFPVYADGHIQPCRFKYQIAVFAACRDDCFQAKAVSLFGRHGIIQLRFRAVCSYRVGGLPLKVLYGCIELREFLQKAEHTDAKRKE